jgi:hypothetical protein
MHHLENMAELRDSFLKHLKYIMDNHPDQRISVLIDSIDKLPTRDLRLEWVPYDLPSNFKLIMTINSQQTDVITRLQQKIPLKSPNFTSIESLQFNEAKQFLLNWLTKSNRQLSDDQWALIDSCLKNSFPIHPLHLKLLYDICVKWTSYYQPPVSFTSCTSIKNTVRYVFTQLEETYGRTLFTRIVFYLTVFDTNGLSEFELLDFLSIDDVLLNSIFDVDNVEPFAIRHFPNALWFRIKYELKDYLCSRDTDNLSVISWY